MKFAEALPNENKRGWFTVRMETTTEKCPYCGSSHMVAFELRNLDGQYKHYDVCVPCGRSLKIVFVHLKDME